MVDPVTAGVVAILGKKALDIIGDAVEDHAKDLVKRLFEKGEESVLGQDKKDALEDACRSAIKTACAQAVTALEMSDTLGWVIRCGLPEEER